MKACTSPTFFVFYFVPLYLLNINEEIFFIAIWNLLNKATYYWKSINQKTNCDSCSLCLKSCWRCGK